MHKVRMLQAVGRNAATLVGMPVPTAATAAAAIITSRLPSAPSVHSRNRRSFSSDAFLNGETSPYIEQMYQRWQQDPSTVHASWDAYFQNLSTGIPPQQAFVTPPSISMAPAQRVAPPWAAGPASMDPWIDSRMQSAFDTSRVMQLVHGYQTRGHEFAKLDPLGLPHEFPFVTTARVNARKIPIDYTAYGFTEHDLDRSFDCRAPGVTGFLSVDRPKITLRELIKRLEDTYCGSIGIEATHIEDQNVKNYLRQVLETERQFQFPPEMRRRILVRTARAQLFESFCGQKFNASKRFGIDGCETAIVILKGIAKKAATMGIDSLLMGMPHRGRLNTLVNVVHKPMEQILLEFQGLTGFGGTTEWGNTGDVKYHLGVDYDHFDEDAKKWIHLGILANPSHLEAVNPLVVGQARAQQYYARDIEKSRVVPILCHGDASFAGQGVVYETLQMSRLPGYSVGGTIHMVVNNQIGFTTNVVDQGSGRYCTDLAKSIEAPVFHVNADDPEACTYIAHLALDFRQKFKSDVFIDLVGYRRFGHNELDMPKFTQPLMYNLVAHHPSVFELYSNKLIAEGVVTKEYVEDLKQQIQTFYSQQYEASRQIQTPFVRSRQYLPQWQHMAHPDETCPPRASGVPLDRLLDLGKEIAVLPKGFNPHPTIGKVYKQREEAIQTGENIDFGFAEALAFATILGDGFHVRIAGQDVERGTFSHRHAVVHDQTVYSTHCPLSDLAKKREFHHSFEARNSFLSEYAAMGFEVGYSLEHPDTLAIWEAQFGDFSNGAQIIIDQFIASGEAKWGSQCGVVLLLPHGYDGQGPEHSSARIERFLQLCDDREDVIHPENWDVAKRSVIQKHNFQVVNCTTPANLFHVLRRQMHRGFRKPLVIFSPKRMLKMRATFSRLSEFAEGTCFLRYIPNITVQEGERPSFIGVERDLPIEESIERLLLCSGQLYYDLAAYREKHGLWNIAIARVEQISPFPFDRVIDDIRRYPNLRDVVWTQEEPMNAGPWVYTSKRIASCLAHLEHPNAMTQPIYVGRDVSAAPAGGDMSIHQQELEVILSDAFDLERRANSYFEKYLKTELPETGAERGALAEERADTSD